jgi:hypothetical protein
VVGVIAPVVADCILKKAVCKAENRIKNLSQEGMLLAVAWASLEIYGGV